MTPEQIQKALKKRKITQYEIAEKLGVSAMSVSRAIKRLSTSDRIFTAVSNAVGMPKEKVFADYYRGPRLRRTSKAMGKRLYKSTNK